MTTGKDIAARRQALDMTQDLLAGASGVSRSTVQRAERGLPISAESMRSIRSVLGLAPTPSPPFPPSLPCEPSRAVTGPVGAATWAWYADPAILLPPIALAVLAPVSAIEIMNAAYALEPSRPTGILRFFMAMAVLALTLPLISLAGRILWRRLRHPSADCLVVGFGTRIRREIAWAGGRVRISRWALPVVRWSSQGRIATTWPGGLLALALAPVATMACHLDPVAHALSNIYAPVGYGSVREIVPAWRIDPASPLAEAGFILGDRIVSIGGIPVRDYMEAWPAIRDGRDEGIEVVVQRAGQPPGKTTYRVPTTLVTLQVHPRTPQGVGPCPDHVACHWIGDISGFVSTEPRPATVGEFLQRFGREVGTVAAMATDPSMAANAVLDGGGGSLSTWVRWMVFESAAVPGIRCLAMLMALLVICTSLVPPVRRGMRRLAKGIRADAPRAGQIGQAFAQA